MCEDDGIGFSAATNPLKELGIKIFFKLTIPEASLRGISPTLFQLPLKTKFSLYTPLSDSRRTSPLILGGEKAKPRGKPQGILLI